MITEAKALEAIQELITELESIYEQIVDYGLTDDTREELESQSGAIGTILGEWEQS